MRSAFSLALFRLPGLFWMPMLWIGGSVAAAAQVPAPNPVLADNVGSELDSLMALARRSSPGVLAAEARVEAARAGISPAAALDDPMLMLGVVNLPLGGPGFRDEMTMKMVGLEQTLPFPGKQRLRREAATHEVESAEAELESARRNAARDVAAAYLQVALADSLEQLAERQHHLLTTVARAAQAGYAASRGGQEEPLRAQTELVRLSGEVTALRTERLRAAVRLNALLGRPAAVPIGPAAHPHRLQRAVGPGSGTSVRFVDTSLGALAAASPLPASESLQAVVLKSSPMVQSHRAELAAQSARVALASRATRPDPTFALQYGQRAGLTDMVSATVSVPLPIWGGRKQGQLAEVERAAFEVLEHEHHRMVAELEAEVLDLVQAAELHRTRLALYQLGVLPRARAAAEAALAGYRTGRTSFQSVLDTYMSLFRDEAEAARLLTEFGQTVLALEALAGREVIS